MEDHGQLIHKCDIDIALAVLDHLGCFRYLDGFRTVHTCFYHQLIDLCHGIQRLRIHTGNDLGNGLQAVYLIARIDTLRRIPDLKVCAAFQSRFLLQDRNTDFFSHAGIYGGFKYHNAALCQIASQDPACSLHRCQIRRMVVIDRCWYRHDMELCFLQFRLIRREFHLGLTDHIIAHLIGRIDAGFIQCDLFRIQVKTNHLNLSRKCHGNGHAHIAKAYQRQLFFSCYDLFIQSHFFIPPDNLLSFDRIHPLRHLPVISRSSRRSSLHSLLPARAASAQIPHYAPILFSVPP